MVAAPRRVVVTGLGLVTPLGVGVAPSWDSLLGGACGVRRVERFDTTRTRSALAGEVLDFDAAARFGVKRARRMGRFSQFALAAAQMAWEGGGLSGLPVPAERMAVAIGVGLGGLPTLEFATRWYHCPDGGRISPYFIPMLVPNMAAANVALHFGAQGPCRAPAAACASGAAAVGDAFHLIRSGAADAALAGGAEATITPVALLGFATMRALSTRNDDPGSASRPFDRGRDGFVLAEGAGVVLLETLEGALQRGAPICAEVVGYGQCGDAYHLTASTPDGAGPARCMALALADAGVGADAVDYICAHATSTPDGDRAEAQGIRRLLGARAAEVPVSSVKGATGHALGAAGGIETVFTALALQQGVLPPTLNLEEPGPASDPLGCDPGLDYVRGEPRVVSVDLALNNSFGFGGTNVSLALRRWNPASAGAPDQDPRGRRTEGSGEVP